MAEISLSSDTEISSEGYFVLSWESDTQLPLTLQQSQSAAFDDVRITNLPADGSITITGLRDGNYFYRVLAADQEQSNIIQVQVEHHTLARAFSFFSLGLVLFIVLLVTILIGRKREFEA